MLGRFILGGVALAATGFGLKRYFDNSTSSKFCNNNSTDEEKIVQIDKAVLKEMIKMFEDEREKLTQTALLELNKALLEIKNLKGEIIFSNTRKKCKFIKVDEKIIEEIQDYTTLLIQTEIFINNSF